MSMIELPDEVMAIVTAQAQAAGVTAEEWLITAVRHCQTPLGEQGEPLMDDMGFDSPAIPAQVRRAADTRREADVA